MNEVLKSIVDGVGSSLPAPAKPLMLDYEDAATRLGVSVATLRVWVSRGVIAFVRYPGTRTVRFRSNDLDAFALSARNAPPSKRGTPAVDSDPALANDLNHHIAAVEHVTKHATGYERELAQAILFLLREIAE